MRFVSVGEEEDACWGWGADAIKDGGHGRIRILDKEYVASRLSWAVHKGEDPGQKCVCHTCDNPTCTNPRHLFLGTHLQNMQDASKKRRFSRKSRRKTAGKFSDNQAAEILTAYKIGTTTQAELAKRYNVVQTAIGRLIRNHRRIEELGRIITECNQLRAENERLRAALKDVYAKFSPDHLRGAAGALELDDIGELNIHKRLNK